MGKRLALIGVDENGYGPVLGPLVVSAASLSLPEVPGEDGNNHHRAHLRPWEDFSPVRKNVKDSKLLYRSGQAKSLRNLEETVLAFFLVQHGFLPDDVGQFLEAVLVNDRAGLEMPCPGGHGSGFCLGAAQETLPGGARVEKVKETAALLEKCSKEAGIAWRPVRSLVFCPALFSRAVSGKGGGKPWLEAVANKSDLVSRAGIHLVMNKPGGVPGHHPCREKSVAVIGKVGGRRAYRAHLEAAASGVEWSVRAEFPASSHYSGHYSGTLPGGETLEMFYLRGAEEQSFAASLASLFGKYVREIFMDGINRFFSGAVPGLPRASGYHDSVTRLFIEKTDSARRRMAISDNCFFRR